MEDLNEFSYSIDAFDDGTSVYADALEEYLNQLEIEGQSVTHSIHALENTYNFLVDQCCDGLSNVKAQMNGLVGSMLGAGVPEEMCLRLIEDFFNVDFDYFDTLSETIVNNDLRLLYGYIEAQENTLQHINGETVEVDLHQYGAKEFEYHGLGAIDQQEQELSLRKQACGKTISFLRNRRVQLATMMNLYEQYCQTMLDSGVPKEYYDEYMDSCFGNIMDSLNTIMQHIRNDCEYISDVYRSIQ